MDNNEAYEKLLTCARSATHDIRVARAKKNIYYGEDPAVPYLDAIRFGNYEGDLSTTACYAVGNLGGNWSASKLIKDKTSPQFIKKKEEIIACKAVIKGFCSGKYKH